MVACVAWPYLHRSWPARLKLEVIREHYRLVASAFPALRFVPPDAITLADVVIDTGAFSELAAGTSSRTTVQVRLDQPGWFEHEGEVTINLFEADRRLYSLVFTLGRVASRPIVYVGALQGLGHTEARDIYRRLTHRMNGLRPRDLLISAFLLLCQSIGVERVLAVSDEASVTAISLRTIG